MADLAAPSRQAGSGPSPPRQRWWLQAVGLLVLYSVPALAYLWPVWLHGCDHLAGRSADPVFNLYVLKWGAHQLRLGLPDLWDANIFYPVRGALAFSDHLIGPAAQLLLLLSSGLAPNAIFGYNALLLSSFVLSGAATCWVLRQSGRSWTASVLGGWMYAFAPVRWAHLEHIQVLLAQWIPLTLWCWDRLLAEASWKRAAQFLPVYLLHLTGGSYLAYMIHVPMLALLGSRVAADWRRLVSWRSLRVLAAVALPAAVVAWLLFAPYLKAHRAHSLQRSPDEVALYSATLWSYLAPSEHNLYAAWWHRLADRIQVDLSYDESRLFAGFLATAFGAYGGLAFWRRHRARPRRPLAFWQLAALVLPLALVGAAFVGGDRRALHAPESAAAWHFSALGLVCGLGLWLAMRRAWGGNWPLRGAEMDPWERGLALGGLACFLLSFPIVFVPLMSVVPGFASLRAPGRFYVFTSLVIVHFAARGLDDLLPAARARRLVVSAALAAALALDLAPAAIHTRRLRDEAAFPAVYQYLRSASPVRAVLELPLVVPSTESLYMYYSTLHWKPLANGYSGFMPDSYLELRSRIVLLPDARAFRLLRERGITHLVVHCGGPANRPVRERLPSWEKEFLAVEIEPVFAAGDDRIYQLRNLDRSFHAIPGAHQIW